ncbi:hypothetical protein JR316_0004364 [Psilocybe cubensis]|uniref:Thioesterase domain-containing protein n=2 Tax=Psilocybe cubensis TaxID=181762 RepID=A0A8H7XXQ9_PSICU|nr:hypothetical protein JR316_0004364 [Psilocybe cubensis]KAH9482266.1 hypothetical protein JR316_0004364 [Psilocybe cubensis]
MSPRSDLKYLIDHGHSPDIMSSIAGNASAFIKEAAVRWFMLLDVRGSTSFGHLTRARMEVKEVSIEHSPDDPQKMSSKMVCELEVTPGEQRTSWPELLSFKELMNRNELEMCNEEGVLSQGCMTGIMDEGSAISLLLMRLLEDENQSIGVSQTFSFFFHHPAPPAGSKIRIVSRSVSATDDIGCCQSEIWDIKNHRLIVTGTQHQMKPSIVGDSASVHNRKTKL